MGCACSELFLGAMTFADGFAHGAGLDEARRIVDAYADAGGNVVDTAINYRDGASEEIVGEVLAGRRDRFVVATKYGVSRDGTIPTPPAITARTCVCRWRRACAGCAPTTSTCTTCTSGTT